MNFRAVFSFIAALGIAVSLEAGQISNQLDRGEFNSQINQDKFVYSLLYGLLHKQDTGYYLEIGSGHPKTINNSYFFEKNLDWDGISIDISTKHAKNWRATRKNKLLSEDATRANYSAILQNFPQVIDYLSLDIDGLYDIVLEKVVASNHTFKVITIEHDSYQHGNLYKDRERQILTALGYKLLCADVSTGGFSFEDWWIHPAFFPSNILASLDSLDLNSKDYTVIMEAIRTLVDANN